MSDIPIRDLAEFCNKENLHNFCYSSDNQDEESCDIDYNLNVQLTFSKMNVCYNPNSVCLSGKSGFMKMEPVKRIFVEDEYSILGKVMVVICGIPGPENNFDTQYRFILT